MVNLLKKKLPVGKMVLATSPGVSSPLPEEMILDLGNGITWEVLLEYE